jgi:hypothetical protein
MEQVLSNTYDFSNLIIQINAIEGDSMEAKLAMLNQCNCCDRHQTNKPKAFTPWYDCESNKMMWHESFIQCECNCRHMARWICRACTDDSSPTQSTLENSWLDSTTTGITEGKM